MFLDWCQVVLIEVFEIGAGRWYELISGGDTPAAPGSRA